MKKLCEFVGDMSYQNKEQLEETSELANKSRIY